MKAAEVPGQVVVPLAVVAFAFLAVGLFVLGVFIVAAIAYWWRGRRHDVGPDALRLQRDLDKHMDRLARRDPEVKAGLARLDAAAHSEGQRGNAS